MKRKLLVIALIVLDIVAAALLTWHTETVIDFARCLLRDLIIEGVK